MKQSEIIQKLAWLYREGRNEKFIDPTTGKETTNSVFVPIDIINAAYKIQKRKDARK